MAGRGARVCTALHSLQRAGGTLGEEGAHAGVQPLPAPQLGAPATPVRAGGMEFTEDNGPPTPPSGQIRDSLSSFRPPLPPLRTHRRKCAPRVHTGPLPTSSRAHPVSTHRLHAPPVHPALPNPTRGLGALHMSAVKCPHQAQGTGSEKSSDFLHHTASATHSPGGPRASAQTACLRGPTCGAGVVDPPETLCLHTASPRQAWLTVCSPQSTALSCLVHVLRAPERVGGSGTPVISAWAGNQGGRRGAWGPRSQEGVTGSLLDQGSGIDGWVGISK